MPASIPVTKSNEPGQFALQRPRLSFFGIMERAFEEICQVGAGGVMVSTAGWANLNGQDVAEQATEAL